MIETQVTSAQYCVDMTGTNSSIRATIDGQELFVPLDPANRHFSAIMRQVSNGTLEILAAEQL